MSIEVFLSPSLQRLVNDADIINASGSNVGECLKDLVRQYPQLKESLFGADGELRQEYVIYINGENAYPGELLKPVKDGDELHVISFFFGG